MVAIVAGNGLGLFNASLNTLGGKGLWGRSGGLGQAGGNAFANVATGNLILQFQDERLSGLGLDLLQSRTYNSAGQLDDADQDNWRWDGERKVALTGEGELGSDESTVMRTTGDGHVARYVWRNGQYSSTEGDGANDVITFDSNASEWQWIDSSRRLVERYDLSTGLLKSQRDSSGNLLSFEYDDSNRLRSIIDNGSGQKIELVYGVVPDTELTRLLRVNTYSLFKDENDALVLGSAIQQVSYGYDTLGRLTSVTTDLTPSSENSVSDGRVYVTNYGYDGESFRIASITQSDGSSAAYFYEDEGEHRLIRVVDAAGEQVFHYNEDFTSVTDAQGNNWEYHYDLEDRLTRVIAPNLDSTIFDYNETGDLVSVTEMTNDVSSVFVYQYDEKGNRVLERDPQGNSVVRTYDEYNQVTTETRGITVNSGDNVYPFVGETATTRYVYDEKQRLRFVVSAEGRVSENVYDTDHGYLISTHRYSADIYFVANLAHDVVLSEAAVGDWALSLSDKTQQQLSTFTYDYRGNLQSKTDFASVVVDENGAVSGQLNDAAMITKYVYDEYGQLLQTIANRGSNRQSDSVLSATVYDGMGRIQSQISANGTQTVVYDGNNRQVRSTNSAGLTVTQLFDALGRLIAVSQSAANETTRTTQYFYDDAGHLRVVDDGIGRSYTFYDENGRVKFAIDKSGAATEYQYNNHNQITEETHFARLVDTRGWGASDAVNRANPTKGWSNTDIVIDEDNDRFVRFHYNDAGQLIERIDSVSTSITQYDDLGRIKQSEIGNRRSRFFYDKDGLLIATLDAEGYLSENIYNADGLVHKTIRYANVTDNNLRATGTLTELKQNLRNTQKDFVSRSYYDAQGQIVGYVNEQNVFTAFEYDQANNRKTSHRYAQFITADDNSTMATITAQLGSGKRTSVEEYDAFGRLLKQTSVDGLVTDYEYDQSGRLQRTVSGHNQYDHAGDSIERGSRVKYNAFGERIAEVSGEGDFAISYYGQNENDIITRFGKRYVYDAFGRLAQTIDANDNRVWFYYDKQNRVTHTVTGVAVGNIKNAQGEVEERVYNAFGQVTETIRYANRIELSNSSAFGSLHKVRDGFATQSGGWSSNTAYPRQMADVNGDGKDDIVGFAHDGVYVALASVNNDVVSFGAEVKWLTGFTVGAGGWSSTTQYPRSVADVNGDGRADIIGFAEHGVLVSLSEGDHFADAVTWSENYGADTWSNADAHPRTIADVNGDGKADLVAFSDDSVHVALSDGSHFGEDAVWLSSFRTAQGHWINLANLPRLTGDINGDGKADVIGFGYYQPYGAVSDGTQFSLPQALSNQLGYWPTAADAAAKDQMPRLIGDFNGDNRADVIAFNGDNAVMHVSNGVTWANPSNVTQFRGWTSQTQWPRMVGDVDGDGKDDLVGFKNDGVYVALSYSADQIKQNDRDALLHVLNQVRDSSRDLRSSTTYNQRGLVRDTTDADGFNTHYEYNDFGELFTSTRGSSAGSVTTQFDYNQRGELTDTRVDVNGLNQHTSVNYDAFGRVIQTTDALGKSVNTTYDNFGRTIVTTETSPGYLWGQKKVTYDAFGRVLKSWENACQPDAFTEFQYDDINRAITVITPQKIKIVTARNQYGETMLVIDGNQNGERTYHGETITHRNHNGQILSQTVDGEQSLYNYYNEAGQLTGVFDGNGHGTSYRYDSHNRVVEVAVDEYGLNLRTRYEFDALGQKVRVTEGAGSDSARVTEYQFDHVNHRQTTIVDPDDLKLTTTSVYDAAGNTVEVWRGDQSDLKQQGTKYYFDKLNRLVQQVDASSDILSANALNITTTYHYDAAGHVTRKIESGTRNTWFVYDPSGRLTYSVNAMGEVSQLSYDENDRVIETRQLADTLSNEQLNALGDLPTWQQLRSYVHADNATDRVNYSLYNADGQLKYSVNALGFVVEYGYDNNGNVTSKTEYDLAINLSETYSEQAVHDGLARVGQGGDTKVTHYVYNGQNRLRFTINAMGYATESVYDYAGNVIRTIQYADKPSLSGDYSFSQVETVLNTMRGNEHNHQTHFIYDRANRLHYTINAEGYLSETVYNALGLVAETRQFDLQYSTANNEADATPRQQLSEQTLFNLSRDFAVGDANKTHGRAFVYDKAGRQRYSVDAMGFVSENVFDALGNVIESRQFDGSVKRLATTPISETALNNLRGSRKVGDGTTRGNVFVYDKLGRQRYTLDAQRHVSETVFNSFGQVTEMRRFNVVAPNTSQTIADLENLARLPVYDYVNGKERIVGYTPMYVTDGVTRGEHYDYDNVGRLTKTTDALGNYEIYKYDAFGNRTQLIGKRASGGSEAVQAQYTWTYQYDKLNRLTDEISPVVNVTSVNDGIVESVNRSIVTHIDYDAFNNVVGRTEDYGQVSERRTAYRYDNLNRQYMTILPGFYDFTTDQFTNNSYTYIQDGPNHQHRVQLRHRSISVSFDAFGNAVRNIIRDGEDHFTFETKLYDKLNRVTHEIDALNQVTAYSYNEFGEVETIRRLAATLNNTKRNDGNLDPRAAISAALNDANDRVITFAYDELGRKTDVMQIDAAQNVFFSNEEATENQQSKLDGSAMRGSTQTKFVYDAFGNVAQESTLLRTNSAAGPEQWSTSYHYYDALNHKIHDVDAGFYHTAYHYDAFGNMDRVTEYAKASITLGVGGQPPALTYEITDNSYDRFTQFNRTTIFGFDTLNRRTSVTRENMLYFDTTSNQQTRGTAQVWHGVYDQTGQLTHSFDALNNETTTDYDALGRVTHVTEPRRRTAHSRIDPFLDQDPVRPTIDYALDAFGNVLLESHGTGGGRGINGGGITLQHRYDAAGFMCADIDALGTVTTIAHDARGNTIRESFDVSVNLGNGSSYSHTVEKRYAYDLTGRQMATTQTYTDASGVKKQSGQLSVYNSFGEIEADYVVAGNASPIENIGDMSSGFQYALTNRYAYDQTGRVMSKQGADGLTVYFYDLAGRNTRIEQRGDDNESRGTNEQNKGFVTRVTENVFDVLGRVRVQRLPQFAASENGETASTNRTPMVRQWYDRWGNVITRQDAHLNETYFDYDQDNRVVKESFMAQPTWQSADATSAVSTALHHDIGYDLGGRAVNERMVASFSGGAEQILRERQNQYNAVGQLTRTIDGTNRHTDYAYDAFGNRVGTRNGAGTVTVDTFDAKGQIIRHSILRRTATSDVNNVADYYYPDRWRVPAEVVLDEFAYDQAGRRYREGKAPQYHDVEHTRQYKYFYTDDEGRTTWRWETETYTVSELMPGTGTASYYYYDERGLLTKSINPENIQKTYSYDALGNKLTETDAYHTQSWIYSDIAEPHDTNGRDVGGYFVGQLQSHVDLGGHVYSYRYTEFGQLRSETIADVTRYYDYHDNGLTKSITDQWTRIFTSNARHETTNEVYGHSTDYYRRGSEYEYNVLGQRTRERHLVDSNITRPHYLHEDDDLPDNPNDPNDPFTQPLMASKQIISALRQGDGDVGGDGGSGGSGGSGGGSTGGSNGATDGNLFYDRIETFNSSSYQDVYSFYDDRGRLSVVYSTNGNLMRGDDVDASDAGLFGVNKLNHLAYHYDALGNRVLVEGNYNDKNNAVQNTQLKYGFDAEGRVIRDGKKIQDYDDAGRLAHEQWGGKHNTPLKKADYDPIDEYERYYSQYTEYRYTDTGQLQSQQRIELNHEEPFDTTQVSTLTPEQRARLRAVESRLYNSLGQMTLQTYGDSSTGKVVSNIYFKDGRMKSQTTTKGGVKTDLVEYTKYDNVGNLKEYIYYGYYNRNGDPDLAQTYTFDYGAEGLYERYQQTHEKVVHDWKGSLTEGNTELYYDRRGQLNKVVGTGGKVYTRYLFNDVDGHVMFKQELPEDTTQNSQQTVVFVNGQQVAMVGKENRFDFGEVGNDEASDSEGGSGYYVVKESDTLAAIAQAAWGDSTLWYIIADANGLNVAGNTELNSYIGQTLKLPNVTRSNHNNASTFKPYNATDVIGDTTPTPAPPKPPKHKCANTINVVSSVAAIVVAAIVSWFFGPQLGAAAGAFVKADTSQTWQAMADGDFNYTKGLVSTQWGTKNYNYKATAISTAAGYIGGTVGGAVGGNVVATAAVSAAVTYDANYRLNRLAGNHPEWSNRELFASVAASVVAAGITQGMSEGAPAPTATNQSMSFSWSSVVTNAVANFVSSGVGYVIRNNPNEHWNGAQQALMSLASGAGQATGEYLQDNFAYQQFGGTPRWETYRNQRAEGMTALQAKEAALKSQPVQSNTPAPAHFEPQTDENGNIHFVAVASESDLSGGLPTAGYLEGNTYHVVGSRNLGVFDRETLWMNETMNANAGLQAQLSINQSISQHRRDYGEATREAIIERGRDMVLNSSSHAQLRAMLNDDARMQQIVSDYTAFRSAQSSRPTLLDQLEEYGVNNNNFAAYALAKGGKATIDIAGGFYDLGGAVHADPLGLLTGAAKSVVDFAPQTANFAVNTTKTILDGYSLIADTMIGGDGNYFAGFRETEAFNFAPIFEYSKSEQAGAILGSVLTGKAFSVLGGAAIAKYGNYGVRFESVHVPGIPRNQAGAIKLEFVRPDGSVIGARPPVDINPALEARASAEALKAKWGHLSADERFVLMNQKAEANAYRRLLEMQNARRGAHFVEKHGAQLDLQSQFDRASLKINPTTGVVESFYPSAATRFLSHRVQLNAINRAEHIFATTGDISLARQPIKYDYIVGSGYTSKTLLYGDSYSVQVALDSSGKAKTAYPIWGQ